MEQTTNTFTDAQGQHYIDGEPASDEQWEIYRLREGLERILQTHCGIPGHAVAVGCGASLKAQAVLEGAWIEECSDCAGNGGTWDTNERNTMVRFPCETCGQRGWLTLKAE